MNKSISDKFKRNLIILSAVITVIFLIINVSLYLINNNYLVNKVEEENEAFLKIYTHIINENDIVIALEYVEHYSHIHEVNIEILDGNDQMVFSSDVAHKYTSRYTIETEKDNFTVFIDNTASVTVSRIESNTVYFNISLLIIYTITMIVLIRMNKTSLQHINMDLKNVLNLINESKDPVLDFHHTEFNTIYKTIAQYLENIDLLTEQKDMNVKGLAHDIKTPLTIVYSYFEKVLREEKLQKEEVALAFESSTKINKLLNDIIENNVSSNYQELNVSEILNSKLLEYHAIFSNKNITMKIDIQDDVYIVWLFKDFSRVLDNIISNAYYYSKSNSEFVISVSNKDRINISFTSTPIDNTKIALDSLFEKGYRGYDSNNENSYGKGLGLYLSKILLQAVEGDIVVEKNNDNVKFTIYL